MRIDAALVDDHPTLGARIGRPGVARVQSCAKAVVWRIVAVLPCRIWAVASAAVRLGWPGVRST